MKQCELCLFDVVKLSTIGKIKMCGECADTYKPRYCRECKTQLGPNRYFNCIECIPPEVAGTDNGELDYFEDVGF